MSYKLKIAKSDYNALTETNPNNLVFSSDYNTLKYSTSGSVSIDLSTGTEFEVTVPHNLGYKPVFFAYHRWDTGDYSYVLMDRSWADAGYFIHVHVFVDNNNLIFKVRQDSTRSMTGTIKYKIFKNSLGL